MENTHIHQCLFFVSSIEILLNPHWSNGFTLCKFHLNMLNVFYILYFSGYIHIINNSTENFIRANKNDNTIKVWLLFWTVTGFMQYIFSLSIHSKLRYLFNIDFISISRMTSILFLFICKFSSKRNNFFQNYCNWTTAREKASELTKCKRARLYLLQVLLIRYGNSIYSLSFECCYRIILKQNDWPHDQPSTSHISTFKFYKWI